jgi:O-antigen/teichoic acid export membrane protein
VTSSNGPDGQESPGLPEAQLRDADGVGPPDVPPGTSSTHELQATVDHAMRGLFGRDSVYMLLWVLQLLGAAAVTPVLTRVLGADEFGGVASANALMQVLFEIAGCGLGVAIHRRYADRGGLAAATGLLTVSIAVAALVTGVVVGTGHLWSVPLGFTDFGGAVRLAVPWAGLSAVTTSCLGLLRSQDRLLAFTSVNLLQSVVAEGASLALVLTVRRTAEMFVLGQVLAQLLALALALSLVRPRRLRRRDLPLVRSGLVFGLPLVPVLLGGLLLDAADRLMVHGYLGSEAVGRYQVAYNVGSIPMFVLAALDIMWLPRIFAVRDDEHRAAVLTASREALYRLLAPVMVGLSLASPLVLRLWAPEQFRTEDLLLVTAVIIISAFPYTAALSTTRGLLARSATGTVAVATVIAALANIGLNVVLIPAHGLTGAAVATLSAFTLRHVLLLTWASRGRRLGLRLTSGFVQTTVASGLALASVLLPVSSGGLTLRAALSLICLMWLGLVLSKVAGPRRSTRHPAG